MLPRGTTRIGSANAFSLRLVNRWFCEPATLPALKPIDKNSRIGWIGTGIMGRQMCKNLMVAGFHNISLYNRTQTKLLPILAYAEDNGFAESVKVKKSPKEVAAESDIVFSIVGYPSNVDEIVFNTEEGMISELKDGKIFVDCTTSTPRLAKMIHEEVEIQGGHVLDAPVSGGDVGAANGTLSFMIGGNEELVRHLTPCFEAMGSKFECMGGAGSGQHTKMVNQILIAGGMMSLAEGLVYAKKVGLDQTKIIELLGSGAAGSWSLSNYGPRIVDRNYEPGFYISHFLKDLKIAIEEAQEMGLNLPSLEMATHLYETLENEGYGQYGTQAVHLLVEQMSNTPEEIEDVKSDGEEHSEK